MTNTWTATTPTEVGTYRYSNAGSPDKCHYEYAIVIVYRLHRTKKLYCSHPDYNDTIMPVTAIHGYWSKLND